MTISGEFVGSPAFCSPEQVSGEDVDHRSDLFSIGSMMYYMLSGAKPYKSAKLSELLLEMVYGEPKPLRQVAPELPENVLAVVSGLMAKSPGDRYQTAAELRSVLQQVMNASTKQIPEDPSSQPPPIEETTEKMRSISRRLPKLYILSGPMQGKEIELSKKANVLGRRGCDIEISDAEISSKHCLLEVGDAVCTLRDLQSRNGTFVEGKRVQEIRLAPGGTFKIGQTHIRILLEPQLNQPGVILFPEQSVKADGFAKDLTSLPKKEEDSEEGDANLVTVDDLDSAKTLHEVRRKPTPLIHMAVKLEVLDGPDTGKVYNLSAQKNVIGRQGSQVDIQDNRVSRKHAEIEIRGLSTVYLNDLASTNGTFLNDAEISRVQLKSGDIVKVGNTRLKFLMHRKT
ncbi:FHA domain-containing protein, partial [Acidobacteriota bacterium]